MKTFAEQIEELTNNLSETIEQVRRKLKDYRPRYERIEMAVRDHMALLTPSTLHADY